jgi:micrococcal nuclease
MVRSGYAAQSTFPPDVKFEERIQEAARFARAHGYGLWSNCQTDEAGDTNELGAERGAPVLDQTAPEPEVIGDPLEAFACDPSYPNLCIPPSPPDLDCGYVYERGFRHITVLPPDPHNLDGNHDGVACEGG